MQQHLCLRGGTHSENTWFESISSASLIVTGGSFTVKKIIYKCLKQGKSGEALWQQNKKHRPPQFLKIFVSGTDYHPHVS